MYKINEALPLNHETLEDAKQRATKHFGYYPFNLEDVRRMYNDYGNSAAINCIDNNLYFNNYHNE